MSENFSLTEEEINKIILRSPYALPDSPAQKGLGAGQIKKYFYDFIVCMAEKLNVHLSDIASSYEYLEAAKNVQKADIEKLNQQASALEEGVADAQAAAELAQKCADGAGSTAHSALEKAQSALNAISNRGNLKVSMDFRFMVLDLFNEAFNVGDMILLVSKNQPDFIVAQTDMEPSAMPDAIVIDDMDNIPAPEVGQWYLINGYAVVAIESGIDTSAFASREALEALERLYTELNAKHDGNFDSLFAEIFNRLDKKLAPSGHIQAYVATPDSQIMLDIKDGKEEFLNAEGVGLVSERVIKRGIDLAITEAILDSWEVEV